MARVQTLESLRNKLFERPRDMFTTALWNVLRKRFGAVRPNPTAHEGGAPTTGLQEGLSGGLHSSQRPRNWHPASVPSLPPSRNNAAYAGASAYDSQFDTRLDADQLDSSVLQHGHRTVMQQVLRGRADSFVPSFTASYGADANVVFDFRTRLVFIDPQAQRQLRVHRELPQPAPGARATGDAIVRELDETLWDMGIAAGPYPLLDAPSDWWRRPLRWAVDARVERYSRIPRHCDLARCLTQGPASPSELRRYASVSVADLRSFIQAGLVLGLLRWSNEDFATTQRQSH